MNGLQNRQIQKGGRYAARQPGPGHQRLPPRSLRYLASLLSLLSLLFLSPTRAAEPDAELVPVNLTAEQTILAKSVKGEVMAPCCWHGTVDSHNSAVANKMANQIDHMVAEGKNRDQILDAMAVEYGERILAGPRTKGNGIWYYLAPSIAVLATGFLLFRWMKNSARSSAMAVGSDAGNATTPAAPATGTSAVGLSDELNRRFEEQLKRMT